MDFFSCRSRVAGGLAGIVKGRGRPLRVLQVITDTDRRGAQVFAMDLGQGLERLGCAVHTVALAAGKIGGLNVRTLGSSRMHLLTVLRLRRLARHADIVVGHGSTTLYACALAVSGQATPFVYRQISDSLFWAHTALRRARVRAALRLADRTVALWSGAATALVEHFAVPPERIDLIPNAVVADRYPRADDTECRQARLRLGLRQSAEVVGYVGALVREKGVDLVIDAIRDFEDTTVVIAGDGPERAALERLACKAGIDARFVGSIEHPRDVYAASDVMVLPSIGGDSMPATMIEAGMLARPCVSTTVGAIPEIVRHAETGFIVPIGRTDDLRVAIQKLLADPRLRRTFGDAARARCERHYTIDVVARQWLTTFARLTSSGPPS